jgi:hypothetical protein
VYGRRGKCLIAFLLALTAAIYIVELTGRWDRTIQDANDEAGLVAIVLCVGAAISGAAVLIAWRPPFRRSFALRRSATCVVGSTFAVLPSVTNGPPIALRI